MKQLATGLWIKTYPLKVLGTNHGRTVSVIRLRSGRMLIHSMAPFTDSDISEIRRMGEPAWLLEAMMLHDTYAREGHERFPGLPFLAPPGFSEVVDFHTEPLMPMPQEWEDEIQVIELVGAPRLKEHIIIHKPSRTLIVADLVFNFSLGERGWDRFFHRHIAGFHRYPGMSRVFRLCISDHSAFRASIQAVLDADFDRIIVGHGEVVETNGKVLLKRAMVDAGIL